MTSQTPLLTLALVALGIAGAVGLGQPSSESESRGEPVALARLPRRAAWRGAGASDERGPGCERRPAARGRTTYAQIGRRLLSFAARLEDLNMKLCDRARVEARACARTNGGGPSREGPRKSKGGQR